MEYAVGIMVLWAALFLAPGIALHWLVLGASARRQALPVALVSGIALGVVLVGAARQAGFFLGSPWLQGTALAASIAAIAAIWRWKPTWRTRELGSAATYLFFAVLLLVMAVYATNTAGPLGYASRHEPVEQVAAVHALASENVPAGSLGHRVADQSDERWSGFERLAAFTLAAGDRPQGGAGSRRAALTGPWSAYTLYDLIAAVLASLVMLPLFVLARWRGVGWLGQVVLLLIGVTSPAVMVALALGQAPYVAAVPFVTTATLALLIARRDRGWYAIGVVNAAAAYLICGPLALVPIVLVGVLWTALRSGTREHLAHTDVPVSRDRPVTAAIATAMFALYAGAAPLAAGAGLPGGDAMQGGLVAAMTSWPFTWVGPRLGAAGPSSLQEFALWLVGPALVSIAVAYGIARKETRELSIVAGVLACLVAGAAWAVADAGQATAFVEFTLLVTSPLLAMVCVRTVGLARASASEVNAGRMSGAGPIVLIAVLALFSVAASSVSGARMVHAPAIDVGTLADRGPTLTTTRDPWIQYLLDDSSIESYGADADRLVKSRDSAGHGSLVYGPYRQVLLEPDPFASDPPSRFALDPNPTDLPARVFVEVRPAGIELPGAGTGEAASGSGAEASGEDAAATPDTAKIDRSAQVPLRHDPVERTAPPKGPGGLLLPASEVESCTITSPLRPCAPDRPVVAGSCSADDLAAARSPLDPRARVAQGASGLPVRRDGSGDAGAQLVALGGTRGVGGAIRRSGERDDAGGTGGRGTSTTGDTDVDADLALIPREPQLIAAACFTVPLKRATGYLKVHVRDVGLVLGAADAVQDGSARAFSERSGVERGSEVTRVRTDERDAVLRFGNNRLRGTYDLSIEGSFGAGAIGSGGPDAAGNETGFVMLGGYGGWTPPFRNIAVNGDVEVRNDTGTRLEVARVVARPNDVAPACDIVVTTTPGAAVDSLVDGRLALHVVVSKIAGAGTDRVATVVVGSYLQRNGLPRTMMVDWTEQYEQQVQGTACDGAIAAVDAQFAFGGGAFADR